MPRQTSLDAWEKLKASGAIGPLYTKMCELLSRSEIPMTDAEMAEKLQENLRSVSTRVPELLRKGILVLCPARKCTARIGTRANSTVRTTDLCSGTPIPLPPAPKRREFWVGVDESGNPFVVRTIKDKPLGFSESCLLKVRECAK